jgi:putative membrane protein
MKAQFMKEHGPGILLVAFHVIGLTGTLYPPTRDLVISLTPINLLTSFLLLSSTTEFVKKEYLLFVALTFAVGMAVEWAGVHTGVIFGSYQYGKVLGTKVWAVPLIIGINWFLLIYIFGVISNYLLRSFWLKVTIAALSMTLLDMIIEPVAIDLGYWNWEGDSIPIKNFVAWFIIGFFLQIAFQRLLPKEKNKTAIYLCVSQLVYFCGCLIFF